jgi:DNA-binding SARP family transcriptional activator
MSSLVVTLLGAPQIELDGRPVHVDRQKALALLAYLAVSGEPHRRDLLAALLWPELDQDHSRASLRRVLSSLHIVLRRRWLAIVGSTVALPAQDGLWIDVLQFRSLLVAYQVNSEASDLPLLKQAAALYKGDFLSGFSLPDSPEFDDWQRAVTEDLRRDLARILDWLGAGYAAIGDYPSAIQHVRRWVRLDPLNEPAQVQLMKFYAESGQLEAAHNQYQHFCQLLFQEIGALPEATTTELYSTLTRREAVAPVAIAEATPPPKPAILHPLPLIGRQDEWRLLQHAWRNATNRKAQVVVLAGEAGIGKTRLAEELVMWAARLGFSTAVAHCYAAEGTLAYAPMVEWLRSKPISQALPVLDTIWLVEIVRLLPELQVSHPHLPLPTPLTEGWQRQRFFEAMARALLHRRQPMLLFIDDLHWCDPEMLEWLHFLMRFDPTAPLLLLTAIRSEEVSATHPVMALLAALDRDSQLTEIVLGRLNADATAEVAAAVAGRPLSREQAAQIYQETEGSPLFIVEMVRSQESEAATQALPSEDTAADPILFRKSRYLPPRVHQIIHTRLNQLSPGARDLAYLAATIGREFTSAVLAMASDLDDDELVRYLDELWQRRILREKGADGYDFSHDKVREVAYMTLSAARRRLLHRRVARALETVQAGEMGNSQPVLDQVSGQIASHYEQAGDLAEAIRYYQQAADVARRLYANSDAIHYYRRALALVEGEAGYGQTEILALYENFSDLLLLTGQPEEAIAMCTHPLAQAQGVDRARLFRKIGNSLCRQHNFTGAFAAYADAQRTLEGNRPAPASTAPDAEESAWWREWIQVQMEINMIHYWLGQVEESADLLQRLQPAVEAWGDQSQRANFFYHRALMTFMRNGVVAPDETIADSRSCLALHLAANDESAFPLDHFTLGFFILWHGEPAAARQEIQIALDLARQRGDITLQARCLTYLTIATRQLGEVDAASDYVAQSFDIAVRARMPEYIALARANESWVAWRAGDWQRARESGCAALTLWKEVDSSHARHPFKWTALWPLIAVAVNENTLHTALEYLHILTSADQQRVPEALCLLIDQIVLSWEQGKIECTRRHLEEALALAQDLHYL